MEINLYNIIIICLLLSIPIILFRKKSQKKSKKKKTIVTNIFKLSTNLLEEVNQYNSQNTKIKFFVFKEKNDEQQQVYLDCDWLNEKIPIKYGENNNIIEVDYKDKDNSYNFESCHKIRILFGEKENSFNIHILLHQINLFNIFIDKNDKDMFSLEQILYSKNKNKLFILKKSTNDIMKKQLQCEDYRNQYFMRCNYINVSKTYLKKILMDYGYELENDKIFEKKNRNLFLNILFGNEKKAVIHIFLNDEICNYEMNENDYKFLDSLYEKCISSKMYELSENKLEEYFENLYTTLENLYNNPLYKEIKEEEKDEDDKEKIKDEDSIENNEKAQFQNEYEKKLQQYLFFVDKKLIRYLSYLLSKHELEENDLILCQKICLSALCLIATPYKVIKRFYELKEKFFKLDNITLYDKLKIMISIKSFLTFEKNRYSFIELVDYKKLTDKSPFLQGYLFYKEIIEHLKKDSLLTFIYNQLNSGSGFDYISKIKCYKLKYIPLPIIKVHLLFNYNDNKYFFIYEKDTNEHAFTEGCSKDIFFNLTSLDFDRSIIYNSEDSNIESNSTKIGLLHLHENSHIKFRKINLFNIKSPRGIIKSDLTLYKNDYESFENNNDTIYNTIKYGESGKAVEYILFNDNNAISDLLKYQNLTALKNYNLYVQNNNDDLINIKKEIMKQKKISLLDKKFTYFTSLPNQTIKKINYKKTIYDTIILKDN